MVGHKERTPNSNLQSREYVLIKSQIENTVTDGWMALKGPCCLTTQWDVVAARSVDCCLGFFPRISKGSPRPLTSSLGCTAGASGTKISNARNLD